MASIAMLSPCADSFQLLAAVDLDDYTVLGYGEWESRQALESHLQQGAQRKTHALDEIVVHFVSVYFSSTARCVSDLQVHVLADYFQEFRKGVMEKNIPVIKSPLRCALWITQYTSTDDVFLPGSDFNSICCAG